MRLVWVVVVGLVFVGVGCDTGAEQRAEQAQRHPVVQEATEIAKVKVTRAGMIYLNGKLVGPEELKQEFARLKQANGAVWYYREDPHAEPPPQAMAVVEAIVEAQLPVRLLEEDFD